MNAGSSVVACPKCGHTNPGGTLFCVKCNTPVLDGAATIGLPVKRASSPSEESTALSGGTPLPPLERGTLLAGGRYEILELLGQGGMGAVYKTKDHEVDRIVALKVVQPELVASSTILKRFKQELLLARQVTHKNVVRIFDIGESNGMKFITMEYIDGGDLKSLIIERGKIPPLDAVDIIRQICNALHAAHSEGVIHRDLKPQNIMIDQSGRVVVMDFGIAHSRDMPGMTITGALMGTPDYMSPEQAKAAKTDARSDIFSLGLIFYEMLTGKVPFHAPTAVETMFKRTQERPTPPAELDHSIPAQANKIVMKCLETDPAKRYQTVAGLSADLEAFDPSRKVRAVQRLGSRLSRRGLPWKWIAVVAILVAIVFVAVRLRQPNEQAKPNIQHPGMQVLVADFATPQNQLDGVIEPVLSLALEGASFITSSTRTSADHQEVRQAMSRLKPNATRMDPELASLVAVNLGMDVVISGTITEHDGAYKISAKAVEAATGKTLTTTDSDAAGKAGIPTAVTKIASSLRAALGDTTSESAKMADAETLTTTSLEAYQSYAQAQDSRMAGKWEEAIHYYENALRLDPNLGRAYSGIAAAYANLGQHDDALKNYELALKHLDRMTEREKLRTRAVYYTVSGDSNSAIQEGKRLVAQYPGDTAGGVNLAVAMFNRRDFNGALVQGREFMKMYPKHVGNLNNVALFSMYLGDFEAAAHDAAEVLKLNPNYPKAYVADAMAALGSGRTSDAIAQYQKLKPISAQGAALSSAGLADIALYEGRIDDGLSLLNTGAALDLTNYMRDSAADKLAAMASVYAELNDMRRATDAAQRAVATGNDDGVLFRAAQVYIEARQNAKAAPLIATLASKLQEDPRAYAKILEGEQLLAANKPLDAIEKFHDAQKLADTWLGHLDAGRAYLAANYFPQASSEFDICAKRRGEATAVFLDDRPSYHLLPQVYYFLGRAQEGMKTGGAAQWYETFLHIKENADKDPLVSDARKRIK
jgi:serine/threonine protein kinase/tetratricopeptide (TPR) repeat protein